VFNLQGSEIIFILLIALVVLGPEKLPDAVKRFTNTYNELRKMGSGLQSELKSVIDEPAKQVRETAALLQDAATPDLFGTDGLPGDEAEFYEPTEKAAPTDEPATDHQGDNAPTDDPATDHQGDNAPTEPRGDGPVESDEPSSIDAASGDSTHGEPPAEHQPAKPVNTIAAANSSAGLAARAAAIERARQATAEREAAASNGAADGPADSGEDESTGPAPATGEAASA